MEGFPLPVGTGGPLAAFGGSGPLTIYGTGGPLADYGIGGLPLPGIAGGPL